MVCDVKMRSWDLWVMVGQLSVVSRGGGLEYTCPAYGPGGWVGLDLGQEGHTWFSKMVEAV